MTINLSDNTPRVSYTVAQGVTQTSFTVSFEFFADADLNVYVDNVLKTLTTDYTVSGGSGSTGTVTISVTGATGGSTVVITRDIALERTTDFPASGAFQIGSLNTELDKITAQFADRKDAVDRSLRLQDSDAAGSMELPLKATRAGTVLGFNATTGVPEAGPKIADVSTLSAVTADIATLADIEDGTDATDAIQTVAGISSNVTTVAGVSANVTTVAGQTTNMQNITDNLSAVQNAATNATTATTKASEAASSATAAASSASSASSSASAAQTAQTAAETAQTAAETAETNAETAETNAAASASTATTKASEASTSAANAATSETNAATSATNAATSATNAATSETNASNSATAAATSAAAAEAAFDAFDDIYLGAKSSAPTVDNDGDALTAGDQYFNTTNNTLFVWNGSAWQAASPDLVGDTTPQLGGNLDLNSNDITGTGNINNTGTITTDGLTVDGDVTLNDGSPNLRLQDSDVNRYVDFLYGTRVATFRNTMASGEDIDVVEPSIVFSFKDDGETRTAMTIDHDSNLLVNGTTHVHAGSAGAVTANVDFDDLVVESNGNMGMSFLSPNDTFQQIGFGDADDNDIGKIAYQHTNDSMQFIVNGSERMRITSGGAVGIGTGSPSRKLDVHSGSDAAPINIRTTQALSLITFDNSSDTSGNHLVGFDGDDFVVGDTSITMRLKSSGLLGLGTSSPQRNLHVHQPTASSSFIQLTNTATGSSTGDDGFRIGTDANSYAYVWQGENQHLAFATSNAEKMRIDSSGNVGIGTSSPQAKTEISGGIDNRLRINSTDGTTSNNYGIDFSTAGTVRGGIRYNAGNNYLAFYGYDNTERLRIDSSGIVLVGKSSTSLGTVGVAIRGGSVNGLVQATRSGGECIELNRTSSDGAIAVFTRQAVQVGNISVTGSSTAYNTSSDYRLKENVTAVTGATDRLKQLNPVRFNFISDPDTTVDGFLAHEAQAIVPEAVTGTKDAMRDEEYEVTPAVLDDDGNVVTEAVMGTRSVPDYQGIDQSKIVPLLTKALIESVEKIEQLEARITALETN